MFIEDTSIGPQKAPLSTCLPGRSPADIAALEAWWALDPRTSSPETVQMCVTAPLLVHVLGL